MSYLVNDCLNIYLLIKKGCQLLVVGDVWDRRPGKRAGCVAGGQGALLLTHSVWMRFMSLEQARALVRSIFSLACWIRQHIICSMLRRADKGQSTGRESEDIVTYMCGLVRDGLVELSSRDTSSRAHILASRTLHSKWYAFSPLDILTYSHKLLPKHH